MCEGPVDERITELIRRDRLLSSSEKADKAKIKNEVRIIIATSWELKPFYHCVYIRNSLNAIQMEINYGIKIGVVFLRRLKSGLFIKLSMEQAL